ncbi:MAG: glycosyltransferase [Bacilli bacterium]
MKILWLTNIPVGDKISSTGSWLENLSFQLEKQKDVQIVYCYPGKNNSSSINRYVFDNKNNSSFFKEVLVKENIDLVHIHGTEMQHSYEMSEICKDLKIPFIISIQGLVSVICKHLEADLPRHVVIGKTFRNVILRDNIIGLSKQYYEKGLLEKKAIQNSKYIIGRTTWDYAMVQEINSNVEYFSCNEVLRSEFYEKDAKWDINKIEKNMIFVSQASYSLKGLHYLLNAMPSILKSFPETHIIVTGKKMNGSDCFKDKIKETYYARYLQKLIKKLKLTEQISFVGNATGKEMREYYLKAHVFVSLSTMENESNSISEAKMIGVPVIGSYVGGVVDRIKHGNDGFLYQHNSPEMLSFYIKKVFSSDEIAKKLSTNGKKNAETLFDLEGNVKKISDVYLKILGDKNE